MATVACATSEVTRRCLCTCQSSGSILARTCHVECKCPPGTVHSAFTRVLAHLPARRAKPFYNQCIANIEVHQPPNTQFSASWELLAVRSCRVSVARMSLVIGSEATRLPERAASTGIRIPMLRATSQPSTLSTRSRRTVCAWHSMEVTGLRTRMEIGQI